MKRTPLDAASDAYATHTRECVRCSTYAGPPLERCRSGGELVTRLAALAG